jgi:hypothetical protein
MRRHRGHGGRCSSRARHARRARNGALTAVPTAAITDGTVSEGGDAQVAFKTGKSCLFHADPAALDLLLAQVRPTCGTFSLPSSPDEHTWPSVQDTPHLARALARCHFPAASTMPQRCTAHPMPGRMVTLRCLTGTVVRGAGGSAQRQSTQAACQRQPHPEEPQPLGPSARRPRLPQSRPAPVQHARPAHRKGACRPVVVRSMPISRTLSSASAGSAQSPPSLLLLRSLVADDAKLKIPVPYKSARTTCLVSGASNSSPLTATIVGLFSCTGW